MIEHDEMPHDVRTDLQDYHARLKAGGNRPVDPAQAVARCLEIVQDERKAMLIVANGALDFLRMGEPKAAEDLLRQVTESLLGGRSLDARVQ